MRADSVGTVCIHVTNMAGIAALIDIYKTSRIVIWNLSIFGYQLRYVKDG